jgi:1-acyl-sn-glycerol-3-phosphate acyltransferase
LTCQIIRSLAYPGAALSVVIEICARSDGTLKRSYQLMLKRFFYRIIAVALIVFVSVTSCALFVIAVIIWGATRPFDRRLRMLHRFTCGWAHLYLAVFPPWSVTVGGRDKIDVNETYVIVSNHQSLLDILVAFTLHVHFKWVSKAVLFRIPFIGWNMRLNRYVGLNRGAKSSIRDMVAACDRHLAEGSSIYMFPEGTRSETEHMKPFKEGAFVLAARNAVPVLPVVIKGSRDALPKHSLTFHGTTHMRVQVLDPIPVDEVSRKSPRELMALVQERISEELARPT